MTAGAGVLVRCEDVARTFGHGRSAVVALSCATCEIHEGEHIAVVGPSGSGKSTLLHVIAGLDEPTTGTVTWPALGDRDRLRPGSVGIVFQGPSLVPSLDVLENVTLPLLIGGASDSAARAAAFDALERLSLGGLGSRLPEELSGGQAQRVAVARALAVGPRLLLADEPTGQLDHETAESVVDVLLHAAAEVGAALVVSTHDLRVAARLDQGWNMVDGRLLVDATRGSAEAPCSR